MNNSTDDKEYWANAKIEDIAAKVVEKFSDYKVWMRKSGYLNRIQTSYAAFYGNDSDGTLRVTRDDDDVANINVNHFKSLVKRLQLIVTENKLDFQPISKSSDVKSMVTADLAKGICTYYGESKDMNQTLAQAVLGALIEMEATIHAPWDLSEGYELTVDGGQVVKTGDQRFELLRPTDVARNTASEVSNWSIIRQKVSKHDMAALYPDFKDEILSDSLSLDIYDTANNQTGSSNRSNANNISPDDVDYVWKYILYHARTPAVPDGKHVEIVAGQVLSFGPLKYEKVPVYRITAGDQIGTPFADSPAISLLPIQHNLNQLFAAVTTNNLNNAVQMIYSQDANLTTRRLSDGQVLVTGQTPPQQLNLTGSSAETYKLIDLLKADMQLISGVNDTARGNPSASVKTSGGQALMIAQAIQFVNDLAKNYAELASNVSTCLVSNIKQFASAEMTAYIVGNNKKGEIKRFKSKDLMDCERISITLGNPLTSSFAGRSELMSSWTQMGLMKDPAQIVTFLQTGNLEQGIQDEWSDAILIADENEMIKAGKKPIASLLDNHAEHIMKHKACSNSPEAREDPRIMAAQLAHMQEHIDLMRQVPPDLAAVLSGQPLPPLAPPQGQPPQDPQQPTVQGQPLPHLPKEAPPSSQANYAVAKQAIPPDQQGPQ